MKCNYPIKYALMAIKRQSGWEKGLNELNGRMVVDYYVVSKCYKIQETSTYNQNGTIKKIYRIVFPYYNEGGKWIRVVPEYSLDYSVSDYDEVEELFDTYENALEVAEEKNQQLLRDLLYRKSNERSNICALYAYKMEEKRILEEAIEASTSDLVVGAKPNEQKILIVKDDEAYVNNSSLYEWMKTKDSYCVFTVTKEEYKLLKKHIKLKGYFSGMSSPKGRPLLFYNVQQERVEVINPNQPDKVGNYYITDSCYLHYDERLESFAKANPSFERDSNYKIYTVETYEDIINSHIAHYVDKGVMDSDGVGVKKLLYVPKVKSEE